MDIIKRAILFGGKAIVSVLDTKELVQKAMDIHEFSWSSAQAMARALTMTAFMSGNFKSEGNKLTIIIEGDGEIGKMVLCGDCGAIVRGYCENSKAFDGEENLKISKIVGKNGRMSVIKDFGMKEPYNGLSELVSGDIAGDFAYYFTVSEQLPSAVALGADIHAGKCLSSGGIVVQPMPNCEMQYITVLEDIVSNFKDVGNLMKTMSAEEIIDFYFGHFEINKLPNIYPKYQCACSVERIEKMIIALGKKDALEICEQQGQLEVNCEFCKSSYQFKKEDIEKLFDDKRN